MTISEQRQKQIDTLTKKLEGEKTELAVLRKKNNYHLVFGEGSLESQVIFIGEAPGKNEAETGRPFVGMAGKRLTELL